MTMRYRLTDYFGLPGGVDRGLRVRTIDGDLADHPPSAYSSVAPAIDATVSTEYPFMPGTLTITRISDDHVFVSGVDFEEVAPNQWTNLTITPGTPIEISYLIDTGRLGIETGIIVQEDGIGEGTNITTINLSSNLNVSVVGSVATISADTGGGGGSGIGLPRECVLSGEDITIEGCEQMPVYGHIRVEGILRVEGSLIIRE
jgi:hypothetical protein